MARNITLNSVVEKALAANDYKVDDLEAVTKSVVEMLSGVASQAGLSVVTSLQVPAHWKRNFTVEKHDYPKGKYTELQIRQLLAKFNDGDHSECDLDEFDQETRKLTKGCPIAMDIFNASLADES